jgi:PAS domain S-box-containing protein
VNGFYFVFYQTAMIFSLLAALFVIMLIWQRRFAPGAPAMIALAAATFVWTLGFFIESHSATLEQQLFFNNIGYLGSMSVPPAWFVFALNYTGGDRYVAGWKIVPICIIPLVLVILVWSNPLHHLMWSGEFLGTSGPFTVTVKTYGPLFWIALAYNYLLIASGAIVLIRRLFVGTPLYMRQAVALIIAVVVPVIWNIIFIFQLTPLPRKDLTPVMFAISGIAISLGLISFRLFLSVPLARKFLIQQLSDGILVFDLRNRLLEANPAALSILGIDQNIIGKRTDTFLSPFLLKHLSSPVSGCIEIPLNVSGEDRFYEIETVAMHDNLGHQVGWLGILRNITEKKKIQEQLIAQDRLASIGKLTSGIAHELNNPLTAVIGFSEILQKRNLPAEVQADIKIIISESERAARIVDNLLTFARQKTEKKAPCDINVIIQKTLELRAYDQARNNIRTITRFDPDLPEIPVNDFQMRQVFLNIIINAEFFMIEAHGKGTLTIITENKDDFVRISIADDGPGIPQENIKYVFTPFFTTKEVGKGTGLGLSICHGIITEHGGTLSVESPPGAGANFIIELPVNDKSLTGSSGE